MGIAEIASELLKKLGLKALFALLAAVCAVWLAFDLWLGSRLSPTELKGLMLLALLAVCLALAIRRKRGKDDDEPGG